MSAWWWVLIGIVAFLLLVALYDVLQRRHSILRVFPVVGHLRFILEAFGPERGMFESNYPVDRWGASYPVLWNAFKRLAQGHSADEKHALFAGTAARIYGIQHVLPAT